MLYWASSPDFPLCLDYFQANPRHQVVSSANIEKLNHFYIIKSVHPLVFLPCTFTFIYIFEQAAYSHGSAFQKDAWKNLLSILFSSCPIPLLENNQCYQCLVYLQNHYLHMSKWIMYFFLLKIQLIIYLNNDLFIFLNLFITFTA